MSAGGSQTGPDSSGRGESGPSGRAEVVGRRAGMALYWLLLVAIFSAGARSIIPEAFGFASTGRTAASAEQRCAGEIRALKADLLDHAGMLIRVGPAELAGWQRRWDSRFRALGAGCGALEPARIDLFTLRSKLEKVSARFNLSHAELMSGIDRAVDRYAGEETRPVSTSNRDESN